ncbi:hypothetical protein [Mesorhizobium sp. SP-1A]|uniref:hypothetical protein n=1 Tax=Mesorhizobium sp. SP-1A TaxID=3077840 RepID=UPI0028F6DD3A|nr:hypothetical protein [Mesorhizobium sp. SP-1A]
MTTKREKAFAELVKVHEKLEDGGLVRHLAFVGNETDEAFRNRIEGFSPSLIALMAAMRELDALMPLERDVENSVWETLVIESSDGRAWLGVENSIGKKDRLTTFIVHKNWGPFIEQWSHCREASKLKDTPWDEARKERRTVNYGGEETTIDRGANFVIDLIEQAGCQTYVSCEGHPGGGYFGFTGETSEIAKLTAEFGRLGWRIEAEPEKAVVRMPKVVAVEERDATWRKLSLEFDYSLLEKNTLKP